MARAELQPLLDTLWRPAARKYWELQIHDPWKGTGTPKNWDCTIGAPESAAWPSRFSRPAGFYIGRRQDFQDPFSVVSMKPFRLVQWMINSRYVIEACESEFQF